MDRQMCLLCKKDFSTLTNLKKHVNKQHSDNSEYRLSLQKKLNRDYSFSCSLCNKNFSHLPNLKQHLKVHETAQEILETTKKSQNTTKCALGTYSADKQNILKHYTDAHEITLQRREITFSTHEAFIKWKNEMEVETNSKFINDGKYILKMVNQIYEQNSSFRC